MFEKTESLSSVSSSFDTRPPPAGDVLSVMAFLHERSGRLRGDRLWHQRTGIVQWILSECLCCTCTLYEFVCVCVCVYMLPMPSMCDSQVRNSNIMTWHNDVVFVDNLLFLSPSATHHQSKTSSMLLPSSSSSFRSFRRRDRHIVAMLMSWQAISFSSSFHEQLVARHKLAWRSNRCVGMRLCCDGCDGGNGGGGGGRMSTSRPGAYVVCMCQQLDLERHEQRAEEQKTPDARLCSRKLFPLNRTQCTHRTVVHVSYGRKTAVEWQAVTSKTPIIQMSVYVGRCTFSVQYMQYTEHTDV